MTNISKMAFEIDSNALAKLVSHAELLNKVVIVDCRCFIDYNVCHIRNAVNAFYSKMMRRRLYDNKVCDAAMLSQLGQENCGELVVDLVLYSETDNHLPSPGTCAPQKPSRRKCGANVIDDSPSKFLRTLHEKLTSSKKFHRVLILRDGFGDFQNRFPELCEGQSDMHKSAPSEPLPTPDGPTEILPFMYLGSQQDALNPELLKKYGIDYVINLSVNCPQPASVQQDGHFMRIPINDSYEDKLLPHFEEAFKFLDKVSQRGSVVLIHCLAGISRSPTLAIAYIMRQYKWTSDQAYRFVKAKRPSISPNFNFMGQLLEYESQLRVENTLHSTAQPPPQFLTSLNSENTVAGRGAAAIVLPPPQAFNETPAKSAGVFEGPSQQLLPGECAKKIAKSASCNELTPVVAKLSRPQSFWDNDASEPSSRPNENGKRIMEPASASKSASSALAAGILPSSCAVYCLPVDRPRGLGGLRARKGLEIPMMAKDELPSPSNEFQKLSFTPSPSETTASNPFFKAARPLTLLDSSASPQPSTSNMTAENPLMSSSIAEIDSPTSRYPSMSTSCCSMSASSSAASTASTTSTTTSSGSRFRFLGRLSDFKKGFWPSLSSSSSSSSSHHRNTGILRSSTIASISVAASTTAPMSTVTGDVAMSTGTGGVSPTSTAFSTSPRSSCKLPPVPELVTRSHSDYQLVEETESPESGYVEGEYLRSATGSDAIDFESETSTADPYREPDRDSISSTSSHEIVVK